MVLRSVESDYERKFSSRESGRLLHAFSAARSPHTGLTSTWLQHNSLWFRRLRSYTVHTLFAVRELYISATMCLEFLYILNLRILSSPPLRSSLLSFIFCYFSIWCLFGVLANMGLVLAAPGTLLRKVSVCVSLRLPSLGNA